MADPFLDEIRAMHALRAKRKPCRRGHIAERLVSNGKCTECLRLAHPWPGGVRKRDIVIV